ncbi:hypothetical protein ACH5RR_010722 [Cinchona calisaya]|uniref:Uncharacterized protein n=1 Tax=Cinchona calisaya TaxID=153742 RepID=A0ABD3AJQ9_9GENT
MNFAPETFLLVSSATANGNSGGVRCTSGVGSDIEKLIGIMLSLPLYKFGMLLISCFPCASSFSCFPLLLYSHLYVLVYVFVFLHLVSEEMLPLLLPRHIHGMVLLNFDSVRR